MCGARAAGTLPTVGAAGGPAESPPGLGREGGRSARRPGPRARRSPVCARREGTRRGRGVSRGHPRRLRETLRDARSPSRHCSRSPVFISGTVNRESSGHPLNCFSHLRAPARQGAGVGSGGQGEVPQAPAGRGGCLWSGLPPCHGSSGPCRWRPGGPARGTPPSQAGPASSASAPSWLLQTPSAPVTPRAGPLPHSAGALFPGTTLPFPALSRSFSQV